MSGVQQRMLDYQAMVEGLQTLDKFTVQIKLNVHFPKLSQIVAMPFTGIVPAEAVNHYRVTFVNHPVGTGPFVLKNFTANFKKNGLYKKPSLVEINICFKQLHLLVNTC